MYHLFDKDKLVELFPIIEAKEKAILNMVSQDGINMHSAFSALKSLYPDMYESVRKNCLSSKLEKGGLLLYRQSTPWILTMPIQKTWKGVYDYDYIFQAFLKISSNYKKIEIDSIAIQEGIVPNEVFEKMKESLDLPELVFYKNQE